MIVGLTVMRLLNTTTQFVLSALVELERSRSAGLRLEVGFVGANGFSSCKEGWHGDKAVKMVDRRSATTTCVDWLDDGRR